MATKARSANRAFLQPPIMGVDFRIPIASMPPEYSPFMMNYETVNGRLRKRDPHSLVFTPVTSANPNILVIPVPGSTKVINIGFNKTEDNEATTPTNTPGAIAAGKCDWIYFAGELLVTGTGVVYKLNITTLAWTLAFTFSYFFGVFAT